MNINIMNRTKSAMTVVEVLVAAVITVVIAGMVYSFISHARYTASLTAAKSAAKQETEFIIRQISRDISNSRAKLIKDGSKYKAFKTLQYKDGVLTLEIPVNSTLKDKTYFDSSMKAEDADFIEVKYRFSKGSLTRTEKGKHTKNLSNSIKKFEIQANYDGKVIVTLTIEKPVKGSTNKISYSQEVSVSVKQAEKLMTDKRWKQRIGAGDY